MYSIYVYIHIHTQQHHTVPSTHFATQIDRHTKDLALNSTAPTPDIVFLLDPIFINFGLIADCQL